MQNSRIVYKVTDEALASARFGGTVYYGLNSVTEAPNNSRLFCFDTLENARNFASPRERIFKARATCVSKPKFCCLGGETVRFWELKEVVRKKKIKFPNQGGFRFSFEFGGQTYYLHLGSPVSGTLFAKTITLLEEIK